MSDYVEKLKDPRWQKLRLKVFERDNWACQKCYSMDDTLVVHHRFYLKGYHEPWEYPEPYLVTLCADCHKEEHRLFREEIEFLTQQLHFSGFFAQQISELAQAFNEMPSIHAPEVQMSVICEILRDEKLLVSRLEKMLNPKKKCQVKHGKSTMRKRVHKNS